MLILGVETSTSQSSVALVDQERVLAAAALGIPRRHGEFLGPALEFCFEQAGAGSGDVTGVAVGLGPGQYTGLRVGIAAAQTFAAARQLPVVGLSGLDVLAFGVRHARRLICASIDAKRGELFWSFYRCVPGGVQRLTELRVGTPDTLGAEIEGAGEEVLVVGEGAIAHREDLRATDARIAGFSSAWPDAGDLAELAVPRFVREETSRPAELQPMYLRQVDAKVGWESRGRLAGGRA